MSLVLQYVQHASVVLNSKLGEHHKYSQVLKSIIDTSDETQAGIIISTICHDPEIHKIYFPVHIDTHAQVIWCTNVLCGYPGAPPKWVMDIKRRAAAGFALASLQPRS